MITKIKTAADFISAEMKKHKLQLPDTALVLGSGLGNFGSQVETKLTIPYNTIPNFPKSTVEGHHGNLLCVIDPKSGKTLFIMQGRVHFYEGYTMQEVTFPTRVFSLLGIKKMIVTNAAGGVNRFFEPGDLMIIRDHINMMGTNPLIGRNMAEFGPRFNDMSYAYSERINMLFRSAAHELGIPMKEGVYMALTGPSFETPAEIRMLQVLGADAVGMSTVPEVIVARHCGIEVGGISFISNKAAGISRDTLSHEEVNENARKVEAVFTRLMKKIIEKIVEN